MKKKLLITLGCSFTEGFGAYDYTVFPKNKQIYSEGINLDIIKYQMNYFHENGWPNKFGKLMGYDKVLNQGLGGGSTSGNLKNFMRYYREENFSDWDVTIFWWLPQSSRVSFYMEGRVRDINPTFLEQSEEYDLLGKFSEFYLTQTDDLDYSLEQTFYLKLLQDYAHSKKWNFIYFTSDYDREDGNLEIQSLYPSKTHIGITESYVWDNALYDHSEPLINPFCHHPNEKGYTNIAKIFHESVSNKFPHLVNSNPPKEMEWEYCPHLNKLYNESYDE